MREHDEQSAPDDTTAEKKNYSSPQLVVYGHIREITRAIGLSGASDGATMGNTKTSLP